MSTPTDDTPRDPLAAMEALLDLLPGSLSEDRDIRRAADAVLDATRPSGDEALAFDDLGIPRVMPAHTIGPDCGPICWTTGHHHDPETCDGCRRLADVFFSSGAALATPSSAPAHTRGHQALPCPGCVAEMAAEASSSAPDVEGLGTGYADFVEHGDSRS